jgi:hypothetical protein
MCLRIKEAQKNATNRYIWTQQRWWRSREEIKHEQVEIEALREQVEEKRRRIMASLLTRMRGRRNPAIISPIHKTL